MRIQLNNSMYDVMKWIVTLVLPALGTLYFTLSQIWGLPYGEEVVGTLTAISLFLGTILKISSSNYSSENEIAETDIQDDEVESLDEDEEDGEEPE